MGIQRPAEASQYRVITLLGAGNRSRCLSFHDLPTCWNDRHQVAAATRQTTDGQTQPVELIRCPLLPPCTPAHQLPLYRVRSLGATTIWWPGETDQVVLDGRR